MRASGDAPPYQLKPHPVGMPPSVETIVVSSTPGNTSYKVGPQDVLDVTVFKAPELSRQVQVAESGTIGMPLIGEVAAAGRTAQEIEREIAQRLGASYLQSPQVSIFVKEFNSQRITVEGAVKKPGVFPYRGRATLIQSIALAEGIDQAVASTEIVVFRQVDGRRHAARFDLEEIRSGTVPDPAIQPGDVVLVNTSGAKSAFNNFVKVLPMATVFVPLL